MKIKKQRKISKLNLTATKYEFRLPELSTKKITNQIMQGIMISQKEKDKNLADKINQIIISCVNAVNQKDINYAKLTSKVTAIDTLIKNERLLRGQNTEKTEMDFSKYTIEDILRMLKEKQQ